jgi:hypothetical protein
MEEYIKLKSKSKFCLSFLDSDFCRTRKKTNCLLSCHSGELRIGSGARIQPFQMIKNSLDSGFHRSDDFLRNHHFSTVNF